MRGARAKEFRKAAYGDISLKAKRVFEKYVKTFRYVNQLDPVSGKPIEVKKISLFNKPRTPRAIYQLMKRQWKDNVRFSWLHQ